MHLAFRIIVAFVLTVQIGFATEQTLPTLPKDTSVNPSALISPDIVVPPTPQRAHSEPERTTTGPIGNIIRNADSNPPPATKTYSASPSVRPAPGYTNQRAELDLGEPGAAPMPVKKCLKLDPESGYGPDIIANFNFPDADVVEIAETLGRITCLNFIFDKDVRGRISIVNNAKITVGDAWKGFLTALDMNGFSIIPSGKFLRIARQRDAKDKQIKTYAGDHTPNTDEYITRILPLKHIDAEEAARTLRNFMPPNTRILAYEQTNTLIITDTGSNVRKLEEMVSHLDVERFDEKITVISLNYASASEIAKMIESLISAGGSSMPIGSPTGFPRMSGVKKTKEGGTISKVIPDDRTNALIVSANEQGLSEVRSLVSKLDTKVSVNPHGSRVRVVYLQYADAEQVTQTLTNLIAGPAAAKTPGTPGGAPAVSGQIFEGTIKVSADKATNALVITGSQSDYQVMSQIISKLDVPRDQVYVEAIIMEIALDKQFQLGTSVASPSSGLGFFPNQDLGQFIQNPFSISGLALGFQSGQRQTLTIPGTNQNVTVSSITGLIHALQQNSNSNILATPQLLTLDNQEAMIEIAENIPVPTSTAIQGAGVATSITREKVALSLKIKPQINKASDFVKLDIDQKLEDISPRTPPKGVADLAFSTSSRSSKTTVVVQDKDTVVFGGLVRDNVKETANKVPLLGDIPVLGWLFRSTTTAATKQNLLVFITPQIIKQYQNMRRVLDQKIRQRDEFIERNNGGLDPFLDQKRDMIKSLPPLATLKGTGRVESSADGETPATIAVPSVAPEAPEASPAAASESNRENRGPSATH